MPTATAEGRPRRRLYEVTGAGEHALTAWRARHDLRRPRGNAGVPVGGDLRRMAGGIPADLRWRRQTLAAAEDRPLRPARRPLPQLLGRNWWLVLAALLGMFELVVGVDIALEGSGAGLGSALPGDPGGIGRRAVIISACGLLALWGIARRRRSRVAGALLVAVGTLPMVSWLPAVGATAIVPPGALTVIVAAIGSAAEARSLGRLGTPLGFQRRMMLGNAVVPVAVVVAYTLMGQPTAGAAIVDLVLVGLLRYIGFRRPRRAP